MCQFRELCAWGVCKTFALQGLGREEDVMAHFKRGIYYMILGESAGERDVTERVVVIVKESGGRGQKTNQEFFQRWCCCEKVCQMV